MGKHTKGEWYRNGGPYHIWSAAGYQIADADCSAHFSDEEREANACMIAAAPEMYEALEGLLERVERNGGIGEYQGGPAFVVMKAKAALAKAKGEAK